jgi:hypothetical protein
MLTLNLLQRLLPLAALTLALGSAAAADSGGVWSTKRGRAPPPDRPARGAEGAALGGAELHPHADVREGGAVEASAAVRGAGAGAPGDKQPASGG